MTAQPGFEQRRRGPLVLVLLSASVVLFQKRSLAFLFLVQLLHPPLLPPAPSDRMWTVVRDLIRPWY